MSLFTINKEKTVSACKNAIENINKHQEAQKEALINEKMKRKWFKPKTREVAWEMVKKDWNRTPFCIFPPWHIGWDIHYKAMNLLSACEITEGETVQLDSEDAEFVKKWSN